MKGPEQQVKSPCEIQAVIDRLHSIVSAEPNETSTTDGRLMRLHILPILYTVEKGISCDGFLSSHQSPICWILVKSEYERGQSPRKVITTRIRTIYIDSACQKHCKPPFTSQSGARTALFFFSHSQKASPRRNRETPSLPPALESRTLTWKGRFPLHNLADLRRKLTTANDPKNPVLQRLPQQHHF